MLEVGYSEILVIAIVLIVVVGPKDLPKMLRAFGKAMTRFRQVSGDFRRQFDDALKEAELDEVRKTIDDVRKLDPRQQVRDVFNPLRTAAEGIRNDVQSAVRPVMQSNPAGAAKVTAPVEAAPEIVKPKARKAKALAAKAKADVSPAKATDAKPEKAASKTVVAAPAKARANPDATVASAKALAKPLIKSTAVKPTAAKKAKA